MLLCALNLSYCGLLTVFFLPLSTVPFLLLAIIVGLTGASYGLWLQQRWGWLLAQAVYASGLCLSLLSNSDTGGLLLPLLALLYLVAKRDKYL